MWTEDLGADILDEFESFGSRVERHGFHIIAPNRPKPRKDGPRVLAPRGTARQITPAVLEELRRPAAVQLGLLGEPDATIPAASVREFAARFGVAKSVIHRAQHGGRR